MTVGQRIKQRRLELHLSADEVADKIGKNRATVYRYEKNDIKDMPTNVLEDLAKVLETTPAHLMGWDKTEHSAEYNHFTNLSTLYFNAIMHWSEELGISEEKTSAIRNHFSELLLRYKTLLEHYFQTNLSWKKERDAYLKLYGNGKNKRSPEEIEELYINQDLEQQLLQLETWISTFPRVIAKSQNIDSEELIAAHHRTDVAYSEEEANEDLNMMSDENF